MADLVEWLTAQLDADEAAVREAEVDGSGLSGSAESLAKWILRTIAAHRAILARHSPRNVMNNDGVTVIGIECDWCLEGQDQYTEQLVRSDWPCSDVLDLASIYADRPGFDPSWRA